MGITAAAADARGPGKKPRQDSQQLLGWGYERVCLQILGPLLSELSTLLDRNQAKCSG